MTFSVNTTETDNPNLKRKTLSLSEKTYNRLAKYGHWSESADQLINRILDERDGKETLPQERSF